MKRVLSWLFLVLCWFLFGLLIYICFAIFGYLANLYIQLSAFLKLIVLFVGGASFLGILIAPLWYGIPIAYNVCEAICPSKRGLRYILFGAFIIALNFIGLVGNSFSFDTIYFIFYIIFGIAFIILGSKTHNNT